MTARLLEGALAGLRSHGVADDAVDVAWVPGAFEIPLVARAPRVDRALRRGDLPGGGGPRRTAHFELVAAEAARGAAEVGRETGVPVIFEVLATESLAQAEARAGGAHGNKGWDAAGAALEMAELLDGFRRPGTEERRRSP